MIDTVFDMLLLQGSLIGAFLGAFINLWMSLGWLSLQLIHPTLPKMSTHGCSLPGNYSTMASNMTEYQREPYLEQELSRLSASQPQQQVCILSYYFYKFNYVFICWSLI